MDENNSIFNETLFGRMFKDEMEFINWAPETPFSKEITVVKTLGLAPSAAMLATLAITEYGLRTGAELILSVVNRSNIQGASK